MISLNEMLQFFDNSESPEGQKREDIAYPFGTSSFDTGTPVEGFNSCVKFCIILVQLEISLEGMESSFL